MSDSVQLDRRQPTRLPRPWNSPGKNTGVGCHFLLQCIKVKSKSEVTQSCPQLHGLQPTRLRCPWDFPGKSTGVGCHCFILQYLLEFAQTHVCRVDDALQPSHPLLSPSPPALNFFQHQGFFQRAPKHSNMLAICYRTLFLPCVSLRLPQWSGREVSLWTFCGRGNITWH